MTPNNSQKSDDLGKPTTGPACPSCGGATLPEATFCHACGASLEEGLGGGKWWAGRLAGLAGIAGSIAAGVFVLVIISEREAAAPSSSAPPPVFAAPPDLSRMTQREAADRLFNRIMMANQQGNRAEALRFVPMAVQAYGGLPALDRDAHYHLGLIHGVAGDRAKGNRHIAALRLAAPNHLLALILEHGIAKRSGDRAAVSRIIATFTAAYDAEIATGRPEYKAHRNTIERFRAAAGTVGIR